MISTEAFKRLEAANMKPLKGNQMNNQLATMDYAELEVRTLADIESIKKAGWTIGR